MKHSVLIILTFLLSTANLAMAQEDDQATTLQEYEAQTETMGEADEEPVVEEEEAPSDYENQSGEDDGHYEDPE